MIAFHHQPAHYFIDRRYHKQPPPRPLCSSLISQAKKLLDELERLDVSFANDLSRLRQTYDTKKANLQAELRRLLDSQGTAAVA